VATLLHDDRVLLKPSGKVMARYMDVQNLAEKLKSSIERQGSIKYEYVKRILDVAKLSAEGFFLVNAQSLHKEMVDWQSSRNQPGTELERKLHVNMGKLLKSVSLAWINEYPQDFASHRMYMESVKSNSFSDPGSTRPPDLVSTAEDDGILTMGSNAVNSLFGNPDASTSRGTRRL
jgi:hypothetical protein